MAAAALLALLLAAAPVRAEPPPPSPARDAVDQWFAPPVALLFAGLDSDRDLVLARDELVLGAAGMFRLADADRSGSLGLIELSRWATAALGDASAKPARFDFDRDEDDQVSPAEFQATLLRQFDRLDVDRDGRLARAEMVALRQPAGPGGRRGEGRREGRRERIHPSAD